jgi:hypothetical protein
VQHPRKQSSSYSSHWEPEISPTYILYAYTHRNVWPIISSVTGVLYLRLHIFALKTNGHKDTYYALLGLHSSVSCWSFKPSDKFSALVSPNVHCCMAKPTIGLFLSNSHFTRCFSSIYFNIILLFEGLNKTSKRLAARINKIDGLSENVWHVLNFT